MKKVNWNSKTSSIWSKRAIAQEKKEIEKVRKIFASKGITGEDACRMILTTRRGGYG